MLSRFIFKPLTSCSYASCLLCLLSALMLCSCASVSVKETIPIRSKKAIILPEKVYIRDFEINDGQLTVDRNGDNLTQFKQDLSDRLSKMLVRHVSRKITPATVLPKTAKLPIENAWLLTGRFEKVEQGSRALRTIVGFGAGATRLETAAFIYDLRNPHSDSPILVIRTQGGSNLMGGLVGNAIGFNPFLFGLNVLTNLQHGLVWDSNRTSREITSALSEFLYKNGAISRKKAQAPKRPGQVMGRLPSPPTPPTKP